LLIDFHHRQSAHCESGVTANLLSHCGLEIDEPLAFGIGAGLFFAYLPFFKVDHIPMTTFRMLPGMIFGRATKMLGVKVNVRRFHDPQKAMVELNRLLAKNIPVGLQVGVYWLPFFPEALRFHFNGHNIIVYGKKNGDYLISDPTLDAPVSCSSRALQKARFAKGPLAPKGKMYYVTGSMAQPDFSKAIIKGVRRTCFFMLKSPRPFAGVHGIRYLAKKIKLWPKKLGKEKALLYLAQIIRMQEEIGTGGAGFRFLYGAFLQEAADILPQKESLLKISREITETGDRWREFALVASRICKDRVGAGNTFEAAADILLDCADREKKFFQKLKRSINS